MSRTARALTLAGATAALVGTATLAATPAFAATSQTFRYSTSGYGADALFSDYPSDGSAAVGTFHDTFVSAATSASKVDGTAYKDNFVFVDTSTYKIDRRGNYTFVSDVSGWADGAAVTLTEDRQLNGATLTATVAQQSCDANWVCTSAGSQTVNVSWTGVGSTTHVVGNILVRSKTFKENGHQNGYNRGATATSTQFGTATWASMYSGRYSDRTSCVGSCF